MFIVDNIQTQTHLVKLVSEESRLMILTDSTHLVDHKNVTVVFDKKLLQGNLIMMKCHFQNAY